MVPFIDNLQQSDKGFLKLQPIFQKFRELFQDDEHTSQRENAAGWYHRTSSLLWLVRRRKIRNKIDSSNDHEDQ